MFYPESAKDSDEAVLQRPPYLFCDDELVSSGGQKNDSDGRLRAGARPPNSSSLQQQPARTQGLRSNPVGRGSTDGICAGAGTPSVTVETHTTDSEAYLLSQLSGNFSLAALHARPPARHNRAGNRASSVASLFDLVHQKSEYMQSLWPVPRVAGVAECGSPELTALKFRASDLSHEVLRSDLETRKEQGYDNTGRRRRLETPEQRQNRAYFELMRWPGIIRDRSWRTTIPGNENALRRERSATPWRRRRAVFWTARRRSARFWRRRRLRKARRSLVQRRAQRSRIRTVVSSRRRMESARKTERHPPG